MLRFYLHKIVKNHRRLLYFSSPGYFGGLPPPPLEIIKNTFWGGEFCIRITKYAHFRFGGVLETDPSTAEKSSVVVSRFQEFLRWKYYKKLHRYVHKEFRKSKAIANFKEILRNPLSLSLQKIRSILSYFYYLPSSLVDRILLNKMSHTNA